MKIIKLFLKNLWKFTIFCILVSAYFFILIEAVLHLDKYGDAVITSFILGYLFFTIILFIYFNKRKKLTEDRSFNSVITAIKTDTKNGTVSLLKQLKELVVGLGSLALLILFVFAVGKGIISLGKWVFSSNDDYQSVIQEHPNYSTYEDTKDCSDLEPDNPYDYDSGHYAGFEWGANGNYCSGNSDSFIEGCEEYENQEAAYDACISN